MSLRGFVPDPPWKRRSIRAVPTHAGGCRLRDRLASGTTCVSVAGGAEPRTLNRKFAARCEAAGVRPFNVHDARHTCATLLVDLDVHPRVIMRILRHADQAVTMEIYANASSAATRDALRRLGDILH
jgi:integrase